MEVDKVIRRTVIDIGTNATVEITAAFMDQMKYLCSEISYVEWSGYVFFSVEGNPKNLDKFKIIPYYIHAMDKGTGGATEFDDDGSLVDFKGNEHMLAFRVTCLNQPGKYNNFNENIF